jgi:hypothetical protein
MGLNMSASHVDVNGREIQVGDRLLWDYADMEVTVTALLPPVDHHSTYVAVRSDYGYYHVAMVDSLSRREALWPNRFKPGDVVIYNSSYGDGDRLLCRVFGFLNGCYVCQALVYYELADSFDFEESFLLFGEDEDLRKVAS